MDNLDNIEEQPQSTPESALAVLEAKYDALSWLAGSAAVLLAILALFVDFYVRNHLQEAQRQESLVAQQISEYAKNDGPKNKEFAMKLQEYDRAHPDFAPILAKYMPSGPPPNTTATKTPATSAPAPPTKK